VNVVIVAENAKLDSLFDQLESSEYKWIDPKVVVVSRWVRMKCMFGCPTYGHVATCPPFVPTIEETKEFLGEYARGVIFRFAKKLEHPDDRKEWSRITHSKLVELEAKVFLSGYHKAFLLTLDECRLCRKCAGDRASCNFPKQARPSMESMGIDVFSTVKKCGFTIQVLENYTEEMNRYALLLIE
jgi:predicted metal-binding protein